MNNLVFNGEGPVMKGWWSNPQTGDSFEVRDTYFEDNQLVVQTTDGRMLNYDIVQNYVQVKDKPNKKPEMNKQNSNSNDEIPEEVTALLDDDAKLILGNLNEPKNINNKPISQPKPDFVPITGNFNQPNEIDINKMVIAKALKDKTMPLLDININWNNIPKDEMNLLINILHVKPEEIINWYLDSININDLLAEAKVKMATKLNNVLNGKEESTIILERTPDPENNAVRYLKYPITDPTPDWTTATKPSDVVSMGEGKIYAGDSNEMIGPDGKVIDMTPKLEAEDTTFQKPKKTTKRKTTKKTK